MTDATGVLATLDTAINTVNSARGILGAQQNRFESTLRSLANVRETTSAAESRIRDVDVAMETADLTRNSILQQASTAILQPGERAAAARAQPPRLILSPPPASPGACKSPGEAASCSQARTARAGGG